jgi:hypothetical protein
MSKNKYIALPKVQPVAGNLYAVSEVPDIPTAVEFCDKVNKRIQIEDTAPNERDRLIRYAHGLVHAGEMEYGMGPFKDDENDSDVDRLAQLFVQGFIALVKAQ